MWEQNTFTQGEVLTAFRAKRSGAWYPRMTVLANGEWICGFDTNEDGGSSVIKVVISSDQGATWSEGITAASQGGAELANAQLAQRKDGQVWLAYRAVTRKGDAAETKLLVSYSKDNGRTWEILPNGEIARESSDQYKGVWEPHMGYMGNTFAAMYANDNLTVVDHGGQQMLYLKKWEKDHWSKEPIVVSDGTISNARDGMPVWSRMKDGRYIVVFETTDENARHPFVIKYKISKDGFNWDAPRRTLYIPEKGLKQGAAPYVITLADGTLVASLQSDNAGTRYGIEASEDMLFMADPNAEQWEYLGAPFSGGSSVWNSLMPLADGGFIALTSSNYPGPETNIVIKKFTPEKSTAAP